MERYEQVEELPWKSERSLRPINLGPPWNSCNLGNFSMNFEISSYVIQNANKLEIHKYFLYLYVDKINAGGALVLWSIVSLYGTRISFILIRPILP
jgi:hypothetical protein